MDILNIIATVISIISLIAVLFQSIILKVTIDNQIYSSFISNSVELDKILIEYPDIRKYVYDNEPVTDQTPDLDRIMSVVELAIDITENIEVYKNIYQNHDMMDGFNSLKTLKVPVPINIIWKNMVLGL